MNLMILGPAGSGKSLLTKNFTEYLSEEGYTVKIINLDPGCISLPYSCDYDVRSKFTVEQIMREEKLGPNGALLKAMEKLSRTRIPSLNADFTLIDTPGQLEAFIFHKAGPKIIEKIGETIGIFLIDATIGLRDLPAAYLYSLAARYRLGIDMITIINKADLLSQREAEKIRAYLLNPATQAKKLKPPGMLAELYVPLSELLQKVVPAQRIPLTSALNKTGLRELLDIIHEVKCACGDLT
ncbi:ATP/GTP-binding protein [Candidatus Bathyarchaeota archaeon]|nr:ATP/GTP-binding protein [Candidatus Bathyarchaeota archaeon]